MAQSKFEVIQEDDTPLPEPVPAHTLDTLLLGLKVLPQRTAVALSNCFALLTVASVFCLSLMIIPYEPSNYQLSGLAGYALFVIAVNIITRRK